MRIPFPSRLRTSLCMDGCVRPSVGECVIMLGRSHTAFRCPASCGLTVWWHVCGRSCRVSRRHMGRTGPSVRPHVPFLYANIIAHGWLCVACCWGMCHYAWTVASGLPLSGLLWPHGVVECLWPFSSCISAAYGRTGPSVRPHAPSQYANIIVRDVVALRRGFAKTDSRAGTPRENRFQIAFRSGRPRATIRNDIEGLSPRKRNLSPIQPTLSRTLRQNQT